MDRPFQWVAASGAGRREVRGRPAGGTWQDGDGGSEGGCLIHARTPIHNKLTISRLSDGLCNVMNDEKILVFRKPDRRRRARRRAVKLGENR